MFLLLLFNVITTMLFRAVINAEEKFLFLKGTELLQLVLQPVLVVLILQEYPYAFSVALVQTVLNVGLILARVYYCFVHLHISIRFHGWDWDLLRDFRKLALSLFAVSLIDQVFFRTNQVILGIIDGTGAVAVYSVAALIYMNYMSLSTAISGVYLPHVDSHDCPQGSSDRDFCIIHSDRAGLIFSASSGFDRIHYFWQAVYSVVGREGFSAGILDDAADHCPLYG